MFPTYLKFYFLEVLNGEDVKKGDKPRLREKGPYAYKQTKEKRDWNYDQQFIYFGQFNAWTFAPDQSCDGCAKEDNVSF